MNLGKIIGTVVATRKDENLLGGKLHVVKLMSMDGKLTNSIVVALDTVGAGEGEIVIVVTGSSARMTESTKKAPVDAAIVAIVDELEVRDRTVYSKSGDGVK